MGETANPLDPGGRIEQNAALPPPSDDIAAARARIEATRCQMAGTVEAIHQQLTLQKLKQEAVETVRETTDAALDSLQCHLVEAKGTVHDMTSDLLDLVHDKTIGRAQRSLDATMRQTRRSLKHAMTLSRNVINDKLYDGRLLWSRTVARSQDFLDRARHKGRTMLPETGQVQIWMEQAPDTMKGVSMSILNTIKCNPLAATVAGAGLVWLFASARSSACDAATGGMDVDIEAPSLMSQARDKASTLAGQVQDKAGSIAGQVQDKAGDLVDQVQTRASGIKTQVQSKANDLLNQAGSLVDQMQSRAGTVVDQAGSMVGNVQSRLTQQMGALSDQVSMATDNLTTLIRDNPLVLASLCLGAGLLLGFLLPQTRQEQELMGESKQQLLQQVTCKVQETADDLKGRVDTMVSDTVNQVAQQTVQTLTDKVTGLAHQAVEGITEKVDTLADKVGGPLCEQPVARTQSRSDIRSQA